MEKANFLPRKPKKCPNCGFSPMGSILYGMPVTSDEFFEKVEKGSLIVGGCSITVPSPKWECKNCKFQYFSEKDKDQFEKMG